MNEQPPIRVACAPLSGFGGGDARYTALKSVKDCRLTDKKAPTIRSKTPVGLTSGYVNESQKPLRKLSKNARRKARRYNVTPR